MKKITVCILVMFLIILSLSSCSLFCSNYSSGTFFSEELLNESRLGDMPVPSGVDNSVIEQDSVLYFNNTEYEYEQYVGELIGYLRAKDDIYYLGYSIGSGLIGEMLPYDEIAPITDSYDTGAVTHRIFFSTEDGLGNHDLLSSPVEIIIIRETGKLTCNDYEYNTRIAICSGSLAAAQWSPCGAGHAYDSGVEYKVPGSDKTVTEYTCVNCQSKRMSEFVGDMNIYKITIADTDADHYLIDRPNEGVSGTVYTIKAQKLIDADLAVTVNGTRILPAEGEFDLWYYSFVMPARDIVIESEVIAGGPNIPAPTNHFLRDQAGCEWLNEIGSEDIAEIKIISEYVGVAPGNLKNISSSSNPTVIARIFDEYYWLDTAPIPEQNGMIPGGSAVTVRLILKDGTQRDIYINNGNYRDTNDNYFELLYTPKFKDSDYAAKAYGFISYEGMCELYACDGEVAELICEIPTDELEFIIDNNGAWLFDNGFDYRIDTVFGKLYFAKDEIFASEGGDHVLVGVDYYFTDEGGDGVCYRLVGRGIDELIDKYSGEA